MPPISLSVAGRLYEIASDDSQVEHLRQLAREVDDRAQKLTGAIGAQPEARLLLMVALTLADELAETKAAASHAQTGLADVAGDETRLVGIIADLAQRIEDIAHRLERS